MSDSEMQPGPVEGGGYKLFIGGLSWDTTNDGLKHYFEKFGNVVDSTIMRDRMTGRSRGFGFVTFGDSDVANRVSEETHVLDGRTIEAKKAIPREEIGHFSSFRTKKVFVGGLPLTLNETEFRQYFERFGVVKSAEIMLDRETRRSRGFGFITFESESTADIVIPETHEINGKVIEVKKAEPKRPGVMFPFGGMRGAPFFSPGGYGALPPYPPYMPPYGPPIPPPSRAFGRGRGFAGYGPGYGHSGGHSGGGGGGSSGRGYSGGYSGEGGHSYYHYHSDYPPSYGPNYGYSYRGSARAERSYHPYARN